MPADGPGNRGPEPVPNESPADNGALSVLEPAKLERLERELKPLIDDRSKRAKIQEVVVGVMSREIHHSGPLPLPADYQGYENTHPGSADRILQMAEKEQSHRHKWENRATILEFVYSIAGIVFGFCIALALIYAAIRAVEGGHDALAGGFIAASAVGMVASFIKGRAMFSNDKEPKEPDPKPQTKPKRGQPAQAPRKGRR